MKNTPARLVALLGLALVAGYGMGTVWHGSAQAMVMAEADLAAIEPASGGGEDASADTPLEGEAPKEGEATTEGAEDAHGEKPKTSHTGKVLSAEPTFPDVRIGATPVITNRMQFEQELATATPDSLREGDEPRILRQRTKLITYAHNPSLGPADARLTMVEFTDMACQPCMKTLEAVDKLMAENPKDIRLLNVHTPLNRFNPVNLPAFYGKVAQRGGVFWPYRKELETLTDGTPEKYFDALMKVGMNRTQARRLMQTEARRFYRELDADAVLTKQMGLITPPHVYVNGIHLGENFIKLEKLPDVVAYELKRPFDKFGYFQ
jgi:hypothetical protein